MPKRSVTMDSWLRSASTAIYAHASFWIFLGLTLLWLHQFLSVFKEGLTWASRTARFAALGAAVLTLATIVACPPQFRVLSDETNLLGVAKSFYESKTAYNVTMGKYYYENFNGTNFEVEKRPLLFPFLVSGLHTFSGYRYQNGFVLNAICLFLILFLVLSVGIETLGIEAGLAGGLFLLSSPILVLGATSGCLEVLGLLLFLICLLFLYQFLTRPDANRLLLLTLSLVLLSQVRYESPIYLIIFLGILLASGRFKIEYLKKKWIHYLIVPLFFLPMIAQRVLTGGDYQQPPGVPVFSVDHFLKWTARFFEMHFDFNFNSPYPSLLLLISYGIGFGLICLKYKRITSKEKSPEAWTLITTVTCLFLGQILFVSHFFGDSGHPSSSRFFLSWSALMSLTPLIAAIVKPDWVGKRLLLLSSLATFLIYSPIAHLGRFPNTLIGNREAALVYRFLEHSTHERNFLLIVDRPGQYTVANYGSVSFDWANLHFDEIKTDLKRHLYDEVYVVQRIKYETGAAAPDTHLSHPTSLLTLVEAQTNATDFTRISKLGKENL